MVHEYAMGAAGSAQRAVPVDDDNSEQFRRMRDEEQQELAFNAQQAAHGLLTSNREKLEEFALALLEHEVLERDEIDRIMKGVPRMERRMGQGLRVVAATAHEDPPDDPPRAARSSAPPPPTPGT
jgi:cell division protease FtsH